MTWKRISICTSTNSTGNKMREWKGLFSVNENSLVATNKKWIQFQCHWHHFLHSLSFPYTRITHSATFLFCWLFQLVQFFECFCKILVLCLYAFAKLLAEWKLRPLSFLTIFKHFHSRRSHSLPFSLSHFVRFWKFSTWSCGFNDGWVGREERRTNFTNKTLIMWVKT